MPLAHMPANEAVARMLNDASIVTTAGGFGLFFGLVVFGMPLAAVVQIVRGRLFAVIPLAVSVAMGVLWFCFYAYSVGDGKSAVAFSVLLGWPLVLVSEFLHWTAATESS